MHAPLTACTTSDEQHAPHSDEGYLEDESSDQGYLDPFQHFYCTNKLCISTLRLQQGLREVWGRCVE